MAMTLRWNRILKEPNESNVKILGYHNIAKGNELRFRPELFIHPHTFEERIQYLLENHYTLLPLSRAVQCLKCGRIPPRALVITFDDGWYGIYRYARPILEKYRIPYTVYIYSYFSRAQDPVYDVLLDYLYYAGRRRGEAVSYLSSCTQDHEVESHDLHLQYKKRTETVLSTCPPPELRRIARKLSEILEVPWEEIERERRFHLMSAPEVETMAKNGADIQLHTHRHRWPRDRDSALREIQENRTFLEPLVGRRLSHFCYPGGDWSRDRFPFLQEAGIQSAVTCDAGSNGPSTHVLALKRFLDGEHISSIEFEAEITGFSEVLRRCRSRLRPASAVPSPA